MSARKKTKLCWHCHGTIPAEVSHCAYCGEPCEPQKTKTPPYFPPQFGDEDHTHSREGSNSPDHSAKNTRPLFRATRVKECALKYWRASQLGALMPALLVGWGAFLTCISLYMFAFSEGGRLRLEFNASRWWLYLIVALAMIWAGILWWMDDAESDASQDR